MEKVTKFFEPLTKYLNPVFNYLDSGKLFKQPLVFLYYAIGIALCVYGLSKIFDIFDTLSNFPGAYKFYNIMMVFVYLGACVFTLVFWLRRGNDIMNERFETTRFLAIPVVTNILRTVGEFFGMMIAYVGVCMGVLTILILTFSDFGGGMDAIKEGLIEIFGGAIGGYFCIVFFRYMAELIMALADIANNTKDAVEELKKK